MLDLRQESPDRRVLKIGISVVFGLVFLLCLIQFTCQTPEKAEEIIETSPTLKEHDRFCMAVPRPADFKLEFRSMGGNGNTIQIAYWFDSNMRFSDVRDFYSKQLESQGWSRTELWQEEMSPLPKHISFKKDQYEIDVELERALGDDPAEYSISCSQLVP